MAVTKMVDTDLHVDGYIQADQIRQNNGGTNTAADTLEHQHAIEYTQDATPAVSTTVAVVHVVRGSSGTLLSIAAGLAVECTADADITIDLKNSSGASVLSAVITLANGNGDFGIITGTISVPSVSQDDVLYLVIVATANAGTVGADLFVSIRLDEDYS